MTKFHYEWWTVEIKFHTGVLVCEYKGKCKESVIRQIKRDFEESNSEKNLNCKYWWEQKDQMLEVYWDTLKLDRIGFKRLS